MAISPINEPNIVVSYESMEMSASDVAGFVAAQGKNCGAPIMVPEPFNMNQSFIDQDLSNSTASSNTAYIAGHIYGANPYYHDWGKEVWMTEHINDSKTDGNNWTKAMNVAREIHNCMYSGYSMYVWWYIKRYYGAIEEDGTITKTGYVMVLFARYICPGYNKIGCTVNPRSGVYTMAYKGDSKLVIVAINQNFFSVSQSFALNDLTAYNFDVYTTTSFLNLISSSLSSSGNSFTATLPGSSITTCVASIGPEPTPAPVVPQDSFSTIGAESNTQMSGVETEICDEGGEIVGYIENGDYTSCPRRCS